MSLTLKAQLGEPGGQGTVFRAVTADGSAVAAKVFLQRTQHCLQPEHDMLDEVGGHQNIIRCLGTEEPVQLPNPRPAKPPTRPTEEPYANPCLKLALASGGDLFDRAFCSGDSLTIAGLHLYGVQMVAGVKHIHSLEIVHLDIKPDNMLIDANGTLMISDFGLARWMPVAAIPAGTQQFAAPELTNKVPLELTGPVNPYAVDVWATGATLLMISISMNPFALGADGNPAERAAGRAALTAVLRNTKAAQEAGRNGVLAACEYFPRGAPGRRPPAEYFRELPEGLQKLLNGMLYVDPALRLTIQQVVEDPWLAMAAPVGPAAAAPAPAVQTATTDPGAAADQGPGYTSLAAAPAPVTAAYRGLSAADDEAEDPRYNSCGASAASFRSLAAEPDEAYIPIPPLMRANAGTLMLG